MNFFSVSGEEMSEFLEDHGNEASLPEERWFTAALVVEDSRSPACCFGKRSVARTRPWRRS